MSARLMRRLRQLHLYLGVFFAPTLLFFTFTGMVQTFDFHEPENHPATWLKVAAQLHKKQALPRPRPASAPRGGPRREEGTKPPATPSSLKIFVGLMAIALLASTLIGIWIAVAMRATRWIALAVLALGTVLPVLLIPW